MMQKLNGHAADALFETLRSPDPKRAERSNRLDLAELNRWPTIAGMIVVFGFVGGFVLWGSLMPLAAGAVAKGVISPDGSKRVVQHLEGGIIAKLHVRDGDAVEARQELLVLENVQPRARHEMLVKQHAALDATRIRLEAEKDNLPVLVFPPVPAFPDTSILTARDGQEKLFRARQETHKAKEDVLRQRVQQLEKEIIGLRSQLVSVSEQLVIIDDELADKNMLTEKGLLRKPELLLLRRQKSDLVGRRGNYAAQIARAEVQIGETMMQLLALSAERTNTIATDLAKVRNDLASLDEQLRASDDILSRTVLVAPVSGVVVNLRFATVGGVVKPGEPILDVVPSEERLLIDARIAPTDIDVVHKGLKAEINLTAFPSRTTPRLQGELISVAADRTVDERTGQPYYAARVEVDPAQLDTLQPRLELVPGMPADVLIVTEQRTMIEYLFEPLLEVVRKSFREV
jgi:HlyD family secretion protein